jgi:hypothetical protein
MTVSAGPSTSVGARSSEEGLRARTERGGQSIRSPLRFLRHWLARAADTTAALGGISTINFNHIDSYKRFNLNVSYDRIGPSMQAGA